MAFTRPMVILVMGLPGSGKSYFAAKLSEAFDFAYISSDVVRFRNGYRSRYGVNDKFEVYRLMLAMTEVELNKGKSVVVDATFYRKSLRQSFARLAAKMQTEIRYVLVAADPVLVRRRLSRERMYSEADFGVYKLVESEFQEVDEPHLALHSTDSNLDEMIDMATVYLRSFADVSR